MKELWFIFLIGCGLAGIKFIYLLMKGYQMNKVKFTKKFSTVLQTFRGENIEKQKTFLTGKKRISMFKEMKNTGKIGNVFHILFIF